MLLRGVTCMHWIPLDPRDIYKYRIKQQTAEYINIISQIIRPTIYFLIIAIIPNNNNNNTYIFFCDLHVQKLYNNEVTSSS